VAEAGALATRLRAARTGSQGQRGHRPV